MSALTHPAFAKTEPMVYGDEPAASFAEKFPAYMSPKTMRRLLRKARESNAHRAVLRMLARVGAAK